MSPYYFGNRLPPDGTCGKVTDNDGTPKKKRRTVTAARRIHHKPRCKTPLYGVNPTVKTPAVTFLSFARRATLAGHSGVFQQTRHK